MTILNIAGLDVGNDEELTRVLHKIYDQGKRIGCLVISNRQLEFIGESYEIFGQSVQLDDGKLRQAIFFDPGWNEIELRIEGDDEKT